MNPSKKFFLKSISLATILIVVFGIAGPTLLSAASTLSVLLGLVVVIGGFIGMIKVLIL